MTNLIKSYNFLLLFNNMMLHFLFLDINLLSYKYDLQYFHRIIICFFNRILVEFAYALTNPNQNVFLSLKMMILLVDLYVSLLTLIIKKKYHLVIILN